MSHNEFGTIAFDLPKNKSNVIKVIGIGGGGSNAINHMFEQGIKGVDFVICNTDAQALHNSGVPNKIQLGVTLTEGLGAGANPEIGKQAAIESIDDIKRMLEINTKMVFITAGMGGGTGTGAAPVIAKLAKELDVLTVGIVTIPFQFEGKMRNQQAQIGVENLRENVDSLIIINNNKLREVYGNLGFKAGFSKADEVLATASRGIAEVITHHYTQNIDLRDAKTVLSNSGTAIMGSASASGQNRAEEAIMKALDSPLLNDNKITGAKNVLLLIVSGSQEITIDEIGEINDHIQNEAGHGANIIMGVGEDVNLNESIAVTIIATGFDVDQQNEISNTEAKRVIHALEDNISLDLSLNKDTQSKDDISSNETNIIEHELEVDDVEDFELSVEKSSDLIRTTNNVSDSSKDTSIDMVENEEFIIEDFTHTPEVETENDSKEEQMSLTFDLPIAKKTSKPIQDSEVVRSIRDLQKNETEHHPEIQPINKESLSSEKRYVLEDIETENMTDKTKRVDLEDQAIVFKTKKNPNDRVDGAKSTKTINPLNSPISELLRARSEDRKRKMKAFNYQFNSNKIDEIEKEPAYKRQGVDLEEVQHSSETNSSRISVSTDDNDEVQLRRNNSFLHDNVD